MGTHAGMCSANVPAAGAARLCCCVQQMGGQHRQTQPAEGLQQLPAQHQHLQHVSTSRTCRIRSASH
jgi:hypothetical protein